MKKWNTVELSCTSEHKDMHVSAVWITTVRNDNNKNIISHLPIMLHAIYNYQFHHLFHRYTYTQILREDVNGTRKEYHTT